MSGAFPQILGALCTAISAAVGRAAQPAEPHVTRHADALAWAVGASVALGCTGDEMREAFGAPPVSPVVAAVQSLLAAKPHWTGPAAELHKILPISRTPKGVSQALHNHQLDLADAGIRVEFHRLPGGRKIITLSSADGIQARKGPPQPSMETSTHGSARCGELRFAGDCAEDPTQNPQPAPQPARPKELTPT